MQTTVSSLTANIKGNYDTEITYYILQCIRKKLLSHRSGSYSVLFFNRKCLVRNLWQRKLSSKWDVSELEFHFLKNASEKAVWGAATCGEAVTFTPENLLKRTMIEAHRGKSQRTLRELTNRRQRLERSFQSSCLRQPRSSTWDYLWPFSQ